MEQTAVSRRKSWFARVVAPVSRETFWLTLQTFDITRILIASVLLLYFVLEGKKIFPGAEQWAYLGICLIYLGLAIGYALLAKYHQRRFLLQLLSQIVFDMAVVSLLYFAAGGVKSGLAILYLFPLAGCAILAPLLWALFFVSGVTLLLLAGSLYDMIQGEVDVSISQAGLYGVVFFAAVLIVNRLAAKLIKQENLAQRQGMALQLQQAVSRLVIADVGDGILVLNLHGAVLMANPAAEHMLGIVVSDEGARFRLVELPFLMPLADAFALWLTRPPTDHAAFVNIHPSGGMSPGTGRDARRDMATHLKLRFARVQVAGAEEERVVAFLQDVTEIENQAQQLKLASMGRLTASIAHEVRNPLSAISYAAALLGEDEITPAQQRLLAIVGDNVARLNRMIEDILRLSRKAQTSGEPLDLACFLEEIVAEFRETQALAPGMIELDAPSRWQVRFDPMHLREVLVNLLSNALRYASGQDDSIRVRALPGLHQRIALHVQDDGPPITPEVRSHLFEPFYTTSSKGTGLGLYLARELCLNNGAMLDYEYHMEEFPDGEVRAGGRFVITLSRADAN
ncbi:MAG: PAS domain-containing protein [Proteobacteria bacterium]|nr:PAS domain-containing protein [Pseudomonadota bacterium]